MRSWNPLHGWMLPLNRWTYISCWGQFPYNPYKFLSRKSFDPISTEVSQSKSYSRKSSHLKVFSLARDAEFGRFVVANKDLGVGDTVMEVAGLIKEMEWLSIWLVGWWLVLLRRLSELHFVVLSRRWSELHFVQERPLSWAPMLDSPPICLTCAKFLQKKSYRFHEWISFPRLSMEN